jgi:hypothetical protein
MIRYLHSTKKKADLRPNNCRRSIWVTGPLLPDNYSRYPVYEQERDVHAEQATSRVLDACGMVHDSDHDQREDKKRAENYRATEDVLPLQLYPLSVLISRKKSRMMDNPETDRRPKLSSNLTRLTMRR